MRDEHFHLILEKLEKTDEKIAGINVTLAEQHISLKEHMRRTELLEQAIKPVQKHVDYVNGALKLVGFIALLAGIYKAFKGL